MQNVIERIPPLRRKLPYNDRASFAAAQSSSSAFHSSDSRCCT